MLKFRSMRPYTYVLASLLVAVFWANLAHAQSESSIKPSGWFDALARAFNSEMLSFQSILLIATGIAISIAAEWLYLRARTVLGRLNPRRASQSIGRIDFRRFRGHKLLLLGEGGAGKSSLLMALSHGAAGRADIKTGKAEFASFSIALGVSSSNPKGSGLLISTVDYNGQQPGSVPGLLKKLTINGKKPVTAIVLVVDVVPPPRSADHPVRIKLEDPDELRINQQIEAWGGNALELVKGELGGVSPKTFILLVNAVDAVNRYSYVLRDPLSDKHHQEIAARFEMFRDHLTKIWRDSRVITITGSVNSHHTQREIRNELDKDAEPGGAG